MTRKRDVELTVRTRNLTAAGVVPQAVLAKWEDEERRYHRPVAFTCETPGCPNEGRVWEHHVNDNADGIWRAICALCGEWIETIVEHPTDKGFTRKEYREAHNGQEWDA